MHLPINERYFNVCDWILVSSKRTTILKLLTNTLLQGACKGL